MPRLAAAVVAIAIVAGGCGSFDTPTLEGTHWRAFFVGGSAPVPGLEPTLTLGPGRVTGSAGCNDYGSQRLEIGSGSMDTGVPIDIGKLAPDVALCDDPAVMQMEASFLEILGDVDLLRLDSGGLILEGSRGRLRFEQVDAPE